MLRLPEVCAVIPGPAPLIPDLLRLNGRWRRARAAVSCGTESLSWGEFDRRTEQVANALVALGLQPGESVAVLMNNGIPMVEALFGAMKAGACVVPLNLSVTDDGIERMLVDAGARVVVATPAQRARLAPMQARLDQVLPGGWLCVDGGAGFADYAAWRDAAPATHCQAALDPDGPCNLIYSSGTTALPKGIVHSHRRRIEWTYDVGVALRYGSNAVAICPVGLFSNISWVAMLCSFLAGGSIVVMDHFDPEDFLATVERHRCTHVAMVPLQFQKVVEDPSFARYDISSMRNLCTVGSPMHPDLKQRVARDFGCDLTELYGLTEGIITTLDPEDVFSRTASVGKPVPGTDLRIIDEEGRELPAGSAGEIVGWSRFVMIGYHNRPDATAEALWHDAEGRPWLRTGDIGKLDEDGYLYIVDRKKDMILSGGQNIFPADIEAAIKTHPAVFDCAVIGIPHDKWGETPLGLVVLRPGHPATPADAEAMRAWVNERVGRQQRLSRLEFRGELPRNPTGKLLKRELRTAYVART
ncbi:MAG: AMP-binding protein [Gammaproteobacteria bacterium]|nr:AMP-binding protein [Gammaproteobacteria bacterium]